MAGRSQASSPAATIALVGLKQLGLRVDSDSSVLHELSQRLSQGMIDGHGSVFPDPDHLIFHVLAICCLMELFKAPPEAYKPLVAAFFWEALYHCRLRRTRVYNARRDEVQGIQNHEWVAVLAWSGD